MLGGAPWLGGQSAVFGAVTEGHGVAGRLAAVGLGVRRLPEQPADTGETRIQAVA